MLRIILENAQLRPVQPIHQTDPIQKNDSLTNRTTTHTNQTDVKHTGPNPNTHTQTLNIKYTQFLTAEIGNRSKNCSI